MDVKPNIFSTALALGVSVAMGTALSGYFISDAVRGYYESQRTVTVKGIAERKVKADRVLASFNLQAVGSDILFVRDEIKKQREAMVDFLKTHSLEEGDFTFSPIKTKDHASESTSQQSALGYDPSRRYAATLKVSISTHRLEAMQKVVEHFDDLLKKGVVPAGRDYGEDINYIYTKLNDIRPEMLEEATRNARMMADQFAADSGASVGPLKRAHQGLFTISDYGTASEYTSNEAPYKKVRVVSTLTFQLAA